MYDFENCTAMPGNHRHAQDHQTTALSLELAVDASPLHHHQTVGAQTGVQGRGGMDLSVAGHHDNRLALSTSASLSAAATSVSRHEHPANGNSGSTTMHEPLKYVNGLHANKPFVGENINYLQLVTVCQVLIVYCEPKNVILLSFI